MVEQWHSTLQANGHRGAIHLGENVIRKVSDEIEKLYARNDVGEIVATYAPKRPQGFASGGGNFVLPPPLTNKLR